MTLLYHYTEGGFRKMTKDINISCYHKMKPQDAEEDVHDVKEIRFGLLTKEEILGMSVVEVFEPKFIPKDKSSYQERVIQYRPNSVYDSRMGPTNPVEICPTCNQNALQCPGHFGHINLSVPVVHPLYTKKVAEFLTCFCIQCARLMFTEDHLHLWGFAKYKRETRFINIVKHLAKGHMCIHCNLVQPTIQYIIPDNEYYATYPDDDSTKLPLRVVEIKSIFERVTPEEVALLGYTNKSAHPRNLILDVFPVIPPRARPFVMGNALMEDDLTTFLTDIIKTNVALKEPELKDARRQKLVQTLNFLIRCMMDNSKGLAKRQNGSAMKGIKERLEGKKGLFRDNIQGRRQNYSARTPIGPGPDLCVNEIAIPPEIANELSYPERVTNFNREILQKLVADGGVNCIVKGDKRYMTEYAKNIRVEIGDVVERKMRDGDWTIINRQPSLHAGSMMAMKVKVVPGKTFRLNLATTQSFNADFDGDEMNLFPPFSEQARAELATISSVHNHIVSAQASKSNITIVQDCLLGSYLMTKCDDPIPKHNFFQIAMSIRDLDPTSLLERLEQIDRVFQARNPSLPLYCGKALFSLLLPRNFIYELKGVNIYAGVLHTGTISKAHLGKGHQSLVRILAKDYPDDDMKICIDFVSNVQFLAIEFLMYNGFSVGIADCITTKDDEIRSVIARAMMEAETAGDGVMDENIKEARILQALGNARDVGMRLAKDSLDPNNRFLDTIRAGSKGDFFNIAQIGGLLGQQNLKGGRIPLSVGKKTRMLPHYPFDMDKQQEYESRGFIKGSFIRGLKPQEFWAHAMSGREGILDTSLKTAASGYIQRKLVKILEDMSVQYDGSVRNSVGNIVQFSYGRGGMDDTKILVQNNEVQFCDIKRMVDMLNLEAELEHPIRNKKPRKK